MVCSTQQYVVQIECNFYCDTQAHDPGGQHMPNSIIRYSCVALLVLAAGLAPQRANAQTDGTRRFVPGELLVGYGSQEDRDAAAKEISEPKVQVRGAKVSGALVQPVGSTIALVRVQFPESLKRGIERDPSAELPLLLESAKNLKEADGRVKYAVPNYVDDLPNPSQGLEPHDSGQIQLQNLKGSSE